MIYSQEKMKSRLFPVFIIISLFIVSCKDSDHIVFTIHDQAVHEVNDMLFGHFFEKASWDGEIGADVAIDTFTGEVIPSVYQLMDSMQIPILRYPGGTDWDYYPWYHLIDNVPGEHQNRPFYRNRHSKEVVSGNQMGLDEYLQLCEKLSIEPHLVVNLGDAFFKKIDLEETANRSASFIAYCNGTTANSEIDGVNWAEIRALNGREKPYNVKYWEIGNEPYLFENLEKSNNPDSVIDHYFECVETIADALLGIDDNIIIIKDPRVEEVGKQMKDRLGDKIDYVVYHPYLPWNIGKIIDANGDSVDVSSLTEEEIWNCWVATPNIDSNGLSDFFVDDYLIKAYSAGYPIAITEWNWNGWWGDDLKKQAALDSRYAKGIGAAGFLHTFMRHGDKVKIAEQSMLVGVSWGITGIRVDKDGQEKPVQYPTAAVTGFYSNHHGNELMKLETRNMSYYKQPYKMNNIKPAEKVAYVDAVATRSGDKLYFHAINRNYQDPVKIELDLKGFDIQKSYQHHVLVHLEDEDLAGYKSSTGQAGRNSIELLLPKKSVSIVEIGLK